MNRFALSGLVLAAMVAVGLGELCTPDLWEGTEAATAGYVYHKQPGLIWEHSVVAYDAKNKRKAMLINYLNNDKGYTFNIIVRYDGGDDSGKLYVLDEKKDKCWVRKLDRPFRKACVPDSAVQVHNYTLGLLKGGLPVSGYWINLKDAHVYIAGVVNGNTIIPVTENVHGTYMGASFVQGIQYANIMLYIRDKNIFDIPRECKQESFTEGPEIPISDFLMNDHFILAV